MRVNDLSAVLMKIQVFWVFHRVYSYTDADISKEQSTFISRDNQSKEVWTICHAVYTALMLITTIA